MERVDPIPESTQLALLAYQTDRSVAENVRESYKDISSIEAIRKQGNSIDVLGTTGTFVIHYMQKNNLDGDLLSREEFEYADDIIKNFKDPLFRGMDIFLSVISLGIYPIYHFNRGHRFHSSHGCSDALCNQQTPGI